MVKRFELGSIQTNGYLVSNQENELLIIDAPQGALQAFKDHIKNFALPQPLALLLTHLHWDHVWEAQAVCSYYKIPCYAHTADQNILSAQTSLENGLHLFKYTACEDEQHLKLGKFELTVLHTPGHSPGSVSYYFKEQKLLFSGDTLFRRSVGATHFQGGDRATLERSIHKKIYTLEDSTTVYPGHGEETTISEEKNENLYVPAAKKGSK